jgi:hypothetical protein
LLSLRSPIREGHPEQGLMRILCRGPKSFLQGKRRGFIDSQALSCGPKPGKIRVIQPGMDDFQVALNRSLPEKRIYLLPLTDRLANNIMLDEAHCVDHNKKAVKSVLTAF